MIAVQGVNRYSSTERNAPNFSTKSCDDLIARLVATTADNNSVKMRLASVRRLGRSESATLNKVKEAP